MESSQRLINYFPALRTSRFLINSPEGISYNCIAWAARDDARQWWPDAFGFGYWPRGIPRVETVEAFVMAYQTLGYQVCTNGDLEEGYEKIALFVLGNNNPTHAARQLPNGKWTSKCGDLEDIEHELDGLVGDSYGTVASYLRRPIR
jgi:hypothetical protein